MNINARLLRLERVSGVGQRAAAYIVLPAGATKADEERAKDLKLRELGLSLQQVTAWLIVRGV